MNDQPYPERANVKVSLVAGDPATRHARQIMLRSQGYDVRSYATCSALLADPRSRDYPCIIAEMAGEVTGGLELLRGMRANGWRGKGILLAAGKPEAQAERHGDRVLGLAIGDGALLTAIEASVDRSWRGWDA